MNDTQREAFDRWYSDHVLSRRTWAGTREEMFASWQAALTQPQAQQAAAVPAGQPVWLLVREDDESDCVMFYTEKPSDTNFKDRFKLKEYTLVPRDAVPPQPVLPVLPLSASKWEVRIAGPDDVHTLDTEIDALRQANEVNKAFVTDCLKNPDDHVLCVETAHGITEPGAGGEG